MVLEDGHLLGAVSVGSGTSDILQWIARGLFVMMAAAWPADAQVSRSFRRVAAQPRGA